MADKKIEKALYGPSTTEVALGAVLGLGTGLLAACVYLVFKPVEQVRELPPEENRARGTIYYIPGSESGAKNRNWTAKQKQFIAGQSVVLVEDELNAWASSTFAAPAAAKPDAATASEGGIFQPGRPNFKITNGKLQIGFKCLLNWYGTGREVLVVTTGDIKRSGDRFTFVPETVQLGSCPLHLLPAVPGTLVAHLMGKKQFSDELKSAWAKVDEVTLEGNTLKLTIQ